MSDHLLMVALVAVVCAIAFLRWWFSADQIARRRMEALPARAIADVAEGETVRIVGRVELVESIRAPLSGRPCACWRVTVDALSGSVHDKRRRWKNIIDDEEGVDFLLRDGDRRALIRASHIRPVLQKDHNAWTGPRDDANPRFEAFLAERGESSEGLFSRRTLRYREGVVEAGETIAVVGVGRWEHDPEGKVGAGSGYREAALPTRLVMYAPDDGPLLVSDEPSVTA